MSFPILLQSAEHKIAGSEINAWLWDFRAQVEQEHGQCILYEKVVDEQNWKDFVTTGIRKMIEHLQGKRVQAPGNASVIVLLWHDSHVHIFRAPKFFERISTLENMALESLLNRARQETPIMALPAPRE